MSSLRRPGHDGQPLPEAADLELPPEADRRYWRSLAELEADLGLREVLEREFPEQAEALADPMSRRNFMRLMGASLALAGLSGAAGCRWDEEEIVPLSRNPEGILPGVPRHFATAMEMSGEAAGLLVTSYDGRPIKIEGNPDHPFSGARTTGFAQASILGMYDPDRSDKVVRRAMGREVPSTWNDFAAAAEGLARTARLRVLAEPISSPTAARLRKLLTDRFPRLEWHEWDPLSRDNEREGMRMAFGEPHRPLLHLDKADVVVALDADFLVDHPAALRYARDFARRRRPEEGALSRVYSVESTFSHTGAMADHRLPLRSELVLPFLLALEAQLGAGGSAPQAGFLADEKVSRFLQSCAEDIKRSRATAVVVAGARQPAAVHAVVARINAAAAEVVEYLPDRDPARKPHGDDIAKLAADMRAGEVDALFILGGNPVYDAPADVGFAEALARVRTSIHLSEYQDETSHLTTWHLPRAHYLEAWGDALTYDHTYTLVQPLLQPLRNGRSAIQVLAMLAGVDGKVALDGQKLVRDTFAEKSGSASPDAGGDAAWRQAVHDGFVKGRHIEAGARPAVRSFTLPPDSGRGEIERKNGELEVVFTASPHTYDGRFANNAWLQEIPSFMTKLVWDNAALMSPRTARSLGVEHGDLISISFPGAQGDKAAQRSIQVAAYVMPGQAPFSIALALGHGRTRAGRVGGIASRTHKWDGENWILALDKPTPGFDVYPLRRAQALHMESGASIAQTGHKYDLVTTQDHWAMDALGQKEIQKRTPELVKTATAEELAAPGFTLEHHALKPHPLWERPKLPPEGSTGRRWGMATDLSTCIGCNACIIACQAENNIPVVGKMSVKRTREMHWMRIDRYFRGEPEAPEIAHQPVACQQCEAAPCEEVCPVGATVHSEEGLNDMTYNRCVGTRYCMNNCPYKVRRFNFLNWQRLHPYSDPREERNQIRKLLFNPEVTVRSRGVVEKCTFCVQRIERHKIQARNEGRPIRDGEFTTACAQVCPTDAIVFGDLADPESRVSKLHALNRKYPLLPDLNTHPRNVYLARISNPSPSMPAAKKAESGHSPADSDEHGKH
jgi:MoCo/4Fe-4S cofactor protein with predicted Tat translocation signal